MERVSVTKVEWLLTDETLGAFSSRARQLAAKDAMTKARDFATELVGIPHHKLAKHVRPVSVEDKSRGGLRTRPQARGYSACIPAGRVSTTALSFAPEDVAIKVEISTTFAVVDF